MLSNFTTHFLYMVHVGLWSVNLFVSTTPFKPLHRVSWNAIGNWGKNIYMYLCLIPGYSPVPIFWRKFHSDLWPFIECTCTCSNKQLLSATPLELLHRIFLNCRELAHNVLMCILPGNFSSMIIIRNMALLNLEFCCC